jgi:hypothetical protein
MAVYAGDFLYEKEKRITTDKGGQAVKTVPDKCPFCESHLRIHCEIPIRSKDGRFATYECKTAQDVDLNDGELRRYGQSELCRKREVQLLTKQRDEARERIKRLEAAEDEMAAWLSNPSNLGGGLSMASQWHKAKEAKP